MNVKVSGMLCGAGLMGALGFLLYAQDGKSRAGTLPGSLNSGQNRRFVLANGGTRLFNGQRDAEVLVRMDEVTGETWFLRDMPQVMDKDGREVGRQLVWFRVLEADAEPVMQFWQTFYGLAAEQKKQEPREKPKK